ncbi:MAG: hypothetical protein JXA38_05635 [Methanosarcinaceae archaeon]|nr:hypothetical protein [Methanosarcinaceae archaeon]
MTTKTELLKAIRKNCLDCCNRSVVEVKECTSKCELWPFRFGADPTPARGKFKARNFTKNHPTEMKFSKNSDVPIAIGVEER